MLSQIFRDILLCENYSLGSGTLSIGTFKTHYDKTLNVSLEMRHYQILGSLLESQDVPIFLGESELYVRRP
jgi:hypothetical protein